MAGATQRLDFDAFKARASVLLANADAPDLVVAAASDLIRDTDIPAGQALEVLLVVYASDDSSSDMARGAGLILDVWQAAARADSGPPPARCLAPRTPGSLGHRKRR